jgi:hypothetical protein
VHRVRVMGQGDAMLGLRTDCTGEPVFDGGPAPLGAVLLDRVCALSLGDALTALPVTVSPSS